MKKILIDVFGSDHPEQLLEGCARCTLEVPDVMLVLPGEEAMLRAELEKYPCNWDALEFMPASEIITNHDDPIDAVMHKRDSTLVKGMQRLKRDPELAGMLTAGSTGAALAGGVAYAGRVRGVRTPALATFLPSIPGRRLCLADCGANVDCKPERMEQFALMATALMQSCGVEEPRVGLLSVGVEESKGSHFIREVYDLLERLPIRFTGMMEARDALSGEYDVIVAEGFSGNVLLKTMEGVSYQDVFPNEQGRLSSLVHTGARFLMPPIPNLYFTRDPFACIGRGVSLNHMFTDTRNRETLYGDYVLRHHPDYAGQVPLYYTPDQYFWIEGGDILNLSRRVLGVGISQRTQPEAIEQLASAIFADESSEIDTVLAFEIPSTRAFMHLDTVFTQVDVDKFTVHPGILGTLRIFELTGRGQGKLTTREVSGPLERVLAGYLGLDRVQLIRCGGSSQIAAEREQWNDGSNTLCIAPGAVVVYDRNYVTNQILEDSGIRVLKMPSAELSRGRGGPRCMSMPLWRDEI